MILHHSFILLFLCLYIFYYNKYMFVLLISHILCSYLGFFISCFESRFKLIKDGNPSIKSTRLSPSRRGFCIFAGSHTERCWRCIIPRVVWSFLFGTPYQYLPGMGKSRRKKPWYQDQSGVLKSLLAQHCFKPAPATMRNVPWSSLTPLNFSQNVKSKIEKNYSKFKPVLCRY